MTTAVGRTCQGEPSSPAWTSPTSLTGTQITLESTHDTHVMPICMLLLQARRCVAVRGHLLSVRQRIASRCAQRARCPVLLHTCGTPELGSGSFRCRQDEHCDVGALNNAKAASTQAVSQGARPRDAEAGPVDHGVVLSSDHSSQCFAHVSSQSGSEGSCRATARPEANSWASDEASWHPDTHHYWRYALQRRPRRGVFFSTGIQR